jgi:hexosaminidase
MDKRTISMLRPFLFLALACLYGLPSSAQSSYTSRYPVIPYPKSLVPEKGSFVLNPRTTIVVRYAPFEKEAREIAAMIGRTTGLALHSSRDGRTNSVVVSQDPAIPAEGYRLSISAQNISLSASTAAGIFYGMETMRQLLQARGKPALALPAVQIDDAPAFPWRGMHLDVARHFFSEAYLKKFIDRMAMYKMNRLHLHLTDDQGWRIQIKKYPELTRQGAWRTFDGIDSACMQLAKENPDFRIDTQHIIHRGGQTLYGGYYTQAQMRSIIRYAAERHIQIIPEIDMPGHMMTAIRIFPALSCTGKAGQGKIFSVPLCPCKQSTYTFADNVYKEIFALFPSKYIHIGGDEVDKTTWDSCKACHVLMQKEGLKNVNELQSYFIHRMEHFFKANGKVLIGWDDIMEGGIDSSAVIMYWRTWVPEAPVKAAEEGSRVIMSPGTPLYFDAWPNKTSLSAVYHFNPIPAALRGTPAAAKIMGAQANVWTERIPSEKRADYMTMPRMTALAEAVWTDQPKDYDSYLQRLKSQYALWDSLHIHYRVPDLEGFTENNVFIDSAVLTVRKPLADLTVHYTLDGSRPDASSPVLNAPLSITSSETVKLAAFTPEGNRGDTYTVHYKRESYLPAVRVHDTMAGLRCIYYKGGFRQTAQMTRVAAADTFLTAGVRVPAAVSAPAFGLRYNGYIAVPATGIYSFFLTSDDGSLLQIGRDTVVDNDGLHSAEERSGQIALQKGLHPFTLSFIEGGGGYTLHLQYSRDGSAPKDIPDSFFVHERR